MGVFPLKKPEQVVKFNCLSRERPKIKVPELTTNKLSRRNPNFAALQHQAHT